MKTKLTGFRWILELLWTKVAPALEGLKCFKGLHNPRNFSSSSQRVRTLSSTRLEIVHLGGFDLMCG